MAQLAHIGTVETVSLPDDGIENIPAKVDTGADGSAIWASGIKLKDGKLSFYFFAPGSAYYRKRPTETTAFKSTVVKNSFGHKELRFKVKLRVKIGSKRVVAQWFSLADRSRNTYPILLGKNFLKKRFVVDVSEQYVVSQSVASHKVLVIDHQSVALTSSFFDKVTKKSKLKLDYACTDYDSLLYRLDGLDTRVENTTDGNTDLAYYTLAYLKSHKYNGEFAAAVAEYLQFKGRPFIDREVGSYISDSKLTEAMKLVCYGLPIPLTICAKTPLLKKRYDDILKQLGAPFVLKEISSEGGDNNHLVANREEFNKLLDAAQPEFTFMAQQYVPNDGLLRIIVAGKNADVGMIQSAKRAKRGVQSHLSKSFSEDNTELVEVTKLPEGVADIALRAAHCLNRQIAGVDLVQDKSTSKWYILEVNSAPQLRSGSFVDEKAAAIAKFFDNELSR